MALLKKIKIKPHALHGGPAPYFEKHWPKKCIFCLKNDTVCYFLKTVVLELFDSRFRLIQCWKKTSILDKHLSRYTDRFDLSKPKTDLQNTVVIHVL